MGVLMAKHGCRDANRLSRALRNALAGGIKPSSSGDGLDAAAKRLAKALTKTAKSTGSSERTWAVGKLMDLAADSLAKSRETGASFGQTVVKDITAVLGSRLSRLSRQSADALIESISLADSPKVLSETLIHLFCATALSFTYSLPVWLHEVECLMEERAIKQPRHGSATVRQAAIKKIERSLADHIATHYGLRPDFQVGDMLSCTPVVPRSKGRQDSLSAQPQLWRFIFEADFKMQYTFSEAEIVEPDDFDFDSQSAEPEISEWALEQLEEDLLNHLKSADAAYDIAGFDVASVEVLDDSLYSVFLDASLAHEVDTVLCPGNDL